MSLDDITEINSDSSGDESDESIDQTAEDELRMRVQKLERDVFGQAMEDDVDTPPQRETIRGLKTLIKLAEECSEMGAPIDEVVAAVEIIGVERDAAKHEIKKLRRRGEVYEPQSGHLRVT